MELKQYMKDGENDAFKIAIKAILKEAKIQLDANLKVYEESDDLKKGDRQIRILNERQVKMMVQAQFDENGIPFGRDITIIEVFPPLLQNKFFSYMQKQFRLFQGNIKRGQPIGTLRLMEVSCLDFYLEET